MSKMWIGVMGLGLGDFSGGALHLILGIEEIYYYYKIWCQGASLSQLGAEEFFPIKNDVSDDDPTDYAMSDITGRIVKVAIEDTFVVKGTVNLDFEVYAGADDNQSGPIFKCQRRFAAVGASVGDISITTRVDTLATDLTYKQAKKKIAEWLLVCGGRSF